MSDKEFHQTLHQLAALSQMTINERRFAQSTTRAAQQTKKPAAPLSHHRRYAQELTALRAHQKQLGIPSRQLGIPSTVPTTPNQAQPDRTARQRSLQSTHRAHALQQAWLRPMQQHASRDAIQRMAQGTMQQLMIAHRAIDAAARGPRQGTDRAEGEGGEQR